MKLLTFEYDNKESLGILVNNNKIYPIKKIGINYESMNELICNISDEEIKLLNNKIFEGFCDNDLISVEEVKKSAPIPIPAQDIICLGINYLISCIAGGDMRYIHFSIITLITGIIMHITMYFVPFESRKMPLFMTIIFTI